MPEGLYHDALVALRTTSDFGTLVWISQEKKCRPCISCEWSMLIYITSFLAYILYMHTSAHNFWQSKSSRWLMLKIQVKKSLIKSVYHNKTESRKIWKAHPVKIKAQQYSVISAKYALCPMPCWKEKIPQVFFKRIFKHVKLVRQLLLHLCVQKEHKTYQNT